MAGAGKQPACIFSPYEEDLAKAATTSDQDIINIRKNLTTEFGFQDNKMDTYLRIRPLTDSEKADDNNETCMEVKSNKDVILKAPASSATFKNNPRDSDRHTTKFTFTEIFGPDTCQQEFFLKVVDRTLQDFVNGENCLVFAYGATNSGKTHTVQGSPQNPGVIPNALEVVFHVLKDHQMKSPRYRPISSVMIEELTPEDQRAERVVKETLIAGIPEGAAHYSSQETIAESQLSVDIFEPRIIELSGVKITEDMVENSSFLIYVSFAEIYNEQLFDLLSPCNNPSKRQKLNLVHDSKGNPYINGLKKVWVSTVEEALKVLHLGRRNLHMAATKLNEQSSRSHCIFTIYVIRVVESENVTAYVNNLSFCDLAGSERIVKTKNTGDRLKEAGNINTSLMVLGRCIDALRNIQLGNQKDKSTIVVPYRDSKLTRLFQAFFSGQGKASMIVNVAPSCFMFDDTLKVMKFSALAKQVVTKDRTEHSISNISSISERLTNIWVKSNRRWSSIAQHHPKQSIMTIPEMSINETEEEEEEDDEYNEQYINDLLEDIKSWTTYSEALEAKAKEYKRKNKDLENQLKTIVQKTKDEDYAVFREHMQKMEETQKYLIEKERAIADERLNKRTELLEKYIEKITRKNTTSDDDDDEDDDEEEEDEQEDEEKNNLKEKLKNLEAQLEKLKSEDLKLSEKYDELEKEYSSKMAENNELLEKCQQLQTDLDRTKSQNENFQSELTFVKSENEKGIKELTDQLQNLQVANEQLKLDNSRLIEKYEQLQKVNSTEAENRELLETQLKEKSDQLRALEVQVEDLKTSIIQSASPSVIEEFKKTVSRLEMELSESSKKLEEKEAAYLVDLDKIATKIQCDSTSEIEEFKKTVSRLETELSNSTKKLKEREAAHLVDLDKMAAKIQSASTSEIEELKKNVARLEMELSDSTEKIKENEAAYLIDFDKMGAIIFDKESANVELTEKINDLELKIGDKSKICQELKKEMADLKKNLKISEDKVHKLEASLAEMEIIQKQQLKVSEDKVQKLEASIAEMEIIHKQQLKVSEDKVRKLEASLAEMENFQKPNSKAPVRTKTKSRRKAATKRREESTSSDESTKDAPSSSKENLTEVESEPSLALQASRSPLAVLDTMMQQSPTIGPVYNVVKKGFERVANKFGNSSSDQVPVSTEKLAISRPRRKLYKANQEMLSTSPNNDEVSPPKVARKSTRSLRTKSAKK